MLDNIKDNICTSIFFLLDEAFSMFGVHQLTFFVEMVICLIKKVKVNHLVNKMKANGMFGEKSTK